MIRENKNVLKFFYKILGLFKSDNFILIIGVLSILPFIVISVYNNPNTDDYCYYNKAQELGYWNAQLNIYNHWNGRFFTTSILTIKNLISDSLIIYKIIPVVLILLLFYSIYNLSSLVFRGLKKRDLTVITFYFLVLYFLQMPNISEGVYWLSGTICYQLANILTLFFLYSLIKLMQTNKRKYLIFSAFLVVFIIGSNEISMLLIDFFVFMVFIYKLIQNQKINYSLLPVLLIAFVFTIIVVMSPGNSIRSATYNNNHQIFAIKQSFFAITRILAKWLPFIILITFFCYDYFHRKIDVNSSKILNIHPLFVFIIICFTLYIGFFTGFWAMGISPPDRAINTIYFCFLIGFVYLIFVLSFRLKKNNTQFISFSKTGNYLLFILIFIRLTDKEEKNNVRLAYSDILSGKAYQYDKELRNRSEIIRNCKQDTCYVPELTVIPYTIFSTDITNDPNHWINQCFGAYYQPPKTIIKKDNSKKGME